MEIDQITYHIDSSPTIRLLRSDHASLALSFFHQAFKKSNRLQIPFPELCDYLEQYLTHIRATTASESYPNSADYYLNLWCDDKHRFIRKYYELDSDEPVTELTYDTERALEWMWNLEEKEFVGTQSRFFSIFDNMEKLAVNANSDPETRIKQLKNQRRDLDAEIKSIQTTGKVTKMDDTHIRERFLSLLEDSRRLISDFRLVEDIFKELASSVKKQKLQEQASRGDILSQVLDAYEYLEESDQGKSFDAFWSFLVSPEQQQKLKTLTDQVLSIPEIEAHLAKNPERGERSALQKMKQNLLQVGQKVLKSKYRLSEELRKLLHQRLLDDNDRIMEIIRSIKKMALEQSLSMNDGRKQLLTTLDFLPDIQLPMERPLWQPKQETRFESQVLDAGEMEADEAQQARLQKMLEVSVDQQQLLNNIEHLLEQSDQTTLTDVVAVFPISKGCAELVTYLSIAANETHHLVDPSRPTTIQYTTADQQRSVEMPTLIFTRQLST